VGVGETVNDEIRWSGQRLSAAVAKGAEGTGASARRP